jgi:hypothetical protein
VAEKLQWSNEWTLHERMQQLVGPVEQVAGQFLRPNFISIFKATRNYHTHFDPHQRARAARDEELHWLVEECFALMQLLLLQLLGVSTTEAWTWMQRTRRVQNLTARRGAGRRPPRGRRASGAR